MLSKMPAVQERDGSNDPLCAYTRGNDLSGSMEGAGGIGGLLARSSGYSGGNFTTHNDYFADGNGNITYMLNSSQAMVASYRYDPFGNTISSSGTKKGSVITIYSFWRSPSFFPRQLDKYVQLPIWSVSLTRGTS